MADTDCTCGDSMCGDCAGRSLLHDRIHPTSGKLIAAHPLRPRTLVAEWWEVVWRAWRNGTQFDDVDAARACLAHRGEGWRLVHVRRYRIEKEPTR